MSLFEARDWGRKSLAYEIMKILLSNDPDPLESIRALCEAEWDEI